MTKELSYGKPALYGQHKLTPIMTNLAHGVVRISPRRGHPSARPFGWAPGLCFYQENVHSRGLEAQRLKSDVGTAQGLHLDHESRFFEI